MTLQDRTKNEEAKYKHDQELAFKTRNRRNKLFGLWVAETHLGKTGEAAQDYAKEIVMADFEHPGDGDIVAKARADLAAAGIEISEHLLHKHLGEAQAVARAQVMSE